MKTNLLNVLASVYFYSMLLMVNGFIIFISRDVPIQTVINSVIYGSMMPWFFSTMHTFLIFLGKGDHDKTVNIHFITLGFKLVELVIIMFLGLKVLTVVPTYFVVSYAFTLLLTHFFEAYIAVELIKDKGEVVS